MSNIPPVKVEIEVDPSAGLQPFFTLDDPVTGLLDGDFGLGGLAFADISEYVQSVDISRGKRNELEQYDAANANVVLDNTKRTFDPFSGSPFSGQLLPRRGIRISSGGIFLFAGIVEDWNLEYEPNNNNRAIAIATDKFLLLANQKLDAYTNTVQASGDRIETVLNKTEVQWPVAERDIDTGAVTLQDDSVDADTNVLNYLKLVSESESGNLFIAADGKLTFQSRLVGPSSTNLVTFADDGTGLPFTNLAVIIGGELLFNRVLITKKDGITQTSENIESQTFFGVSTLSKSDLLMNLDSEALSKSQRLLARYKEPGYRFERLDLQLAGIDSADQLDILEKELTDVIEVKFKPNQIGDSIDRYGRIIGISHAINISGSHRITLNLETLDYAPIVLDDAVFGVLGDYGLG